MELWKAVALGVIQGLTEFLPVSSSGHLVIAKSLFGFQKGQGPFWEVVVHFGTFLAIVVVFRREIRTLACTAARLLHDVLGGKDRRAVLRAEPRLPVLVGLLVGSVPAALVGLTFEESITGLFDSPLVASALLAVTGLILLATAWAPPPAKARVTVLDSLLVGCAQALAILPGISRSGTTIAAGVFRRVDRAEAGKFSFLLALPALAGATLLEALKVDSFSGHGPAAVLAAVAAAFLTGWAALSLLMRLVRAGKLYWFAAYCLPAGAISFAWFVSAA